MPAAALPAVAVNKNASILSRRGRGYDALTAEAKKYAKQAEELEAQLAHCAGRPNSVQQQWTT